MKGLLKSLFGQRNKRGMELEYLGWLILGLIALVIFVIIILIFKEKGTNAIDYIKQLFRFGI